MKPSIDRSQKEGYHQWGKPPITYGSFEVFWHEAKETDPPELDSGGWYWWPCFPGCLPDGEASGPFPTSTLAWKDARND